METISAFLALGEGGHQSRVVLYRQPKMQSFDVVFVVCPKKQYTASDLRCHAIHCHALSPINWMAPHADTFLFPPSELQLLSIKSPTSAAQHITIYIWLPTHDMKTSNTRLVPGFEVLTATADGQGAVSSRII